MAVNKWTKWSKENKSESNEDLKRLDWLVYVYSQKFLATQLHYINTSDAEDAPVI